MPNYTKADTSKATPIKKGGVKLQHNLLDIVGETLLYGLQRGRLSPEHFKDFQANVDLDLGEGYSANLGYNEYMGDLRQDLKLTLSKRF